MLSAICIGIGDLQYFGYIDCKILQSHAQAKIGVVDPSRCVSFMDFSLALAV